jgi:hypothetical protein
MTAQSARWKKLALTNFSKPPTISSVDDCAADVVDEEDRGIGGGDGDDMDDEDEDADDVDDGDDDDDDGDDDDCMCGGGKGMLGPLGSIKYCAMMTPWKPFVVEPEVCNKPAKSTISEDIKMKKRER